MPDQTAERAGTFARDASVQYPLRRAGRHVVELTRLAGPIVLSRASSFAMAVVDTVMVGRFSAVELGHLSIGLAPVGAVLVTGFGLLIGTLVFTAQAFGRGDDAECGAVWRRSLIYAVMIGAVTAGLSAMAGPFLHAIGQSPEIAQAGGKVALILALGMPPMMLAIVCIYFLEGIQRPAPAMFIMFAANAVNVFLNWLLIYGNGGFPALGAEGSAWATTIVRYVNAVIFILFILWMRDRDRFAIRIFSLSRWRDWVAQRRVGYAHGGSVGVETLAFSSMTVFAGYLGAIPLAAYSIVINVVAVVFMAALGIAQATAVRVGAAHGRGDKADVALAGWTGLVVCTGIMLLAGVAFVAAPASIAGLYTADKETIALCIPLLSFAAYMLVFDGGQSVVANALRALGETWIPTATHVISYVFLMMPLAWWLAITRGRGAMGLIEAIVIASILAVLLLAVRFWWRVHRASG